jgi:hypothetical protein
MFGRTCIYWFQLDKASLAIPKTKVMRKLWYRLLTSTGMTWLGMKIRQLFFEYQATRNHEKGEGELE